MGPEDQHPWDREDEEIRQAFAKKEAEIERLKAQIARLQEQGFHDQVELLRLTGEVGPEKDAEIERQKQLITELVYWIENLWPSLSWGSDDSTMGRVRKLIQQGREATQ